MSALANLANLAARIWPRRKVLVAVPAGSEGIYRLAFNLEWRDATDPRITFMPRSDGVWIKWEDCDVSVHAKTHAWRIDTAERSPDITKAAVLNFHVSAIRPETPRPGVPAVETVPTELLDLTFAVQYNRSCPSPWLVRLCGNSSAVIDLKPYSGFGVDRSTLTKDILGFGKTFAEAAAEAIAKRRPMMLRSQITPPPAWLDGEGGDA